MYSTAKIVTLTVLSAVSMVALVIAEVPHSVLALAAYSIGCAMGYLAGIYDVKAKRPNDTDGQSY